VTQESRRHLELCCLIEHEHQTLYRKAPPSGDPIFTSALTLGNSASGNFPSRQLVNRGKPPLALGPSLFTGLRFVVILRLAANAIGINKPRRYKKEVAHSEAHT
jgi:hypothetical protein